MEVDQALPNRPWSIRPTGDNPVLHQYWNRAWNDESLHLGGPPPHHSFVDMSRENTQPQILGSQD